LRLYAATIKAQIGSEGLDARYWYEALTFLAGAWKLLDEVMRGILREHGDMIGDLDLLHPEPILSIPSENWEQHVPAELVPALKDFHERMAAKPNLVAIAGNGHDTTPTPTAA
jgi:hypothetical protein